MHRDPGVVCLSVRVDSPWRPAKRSWAACATKESAPRISSASGKVARTRLSVAASLGARAGTSNGPSTNVPAKIRRASDDGPSPMTRSAMSLRFRLSMALVSGGRSSGAVSRSLTSRIEPSLTPSRSSIVLASTSAAEICVPARNVCVHGFTGCPSRGGTSSRSTGRS